MAKKLGMPPGWGPKLIRHSVATILTARRIDLIELEIALGHRVLNKPPASTRSLILSISSPSGRGVPTFGWTSNSVANTRDMQISRKLTSRRGDGDLNKVHISGRKNGGRGKD